MDRRGMATVAVVAFEMPGDRVRARVQALRDEPGPQLADQRGDLRRRRGRLPFRSPRTWFERTLTLGPVAGDEFVGPRTRHAVSRNNFRHRTTLEDDRGDDQPGS